MIKSYFFHSEDFAYSEFIGSVDIETASLLNGAELDGWFDIKVKKNGKKRGQLNLRVLYISRQTMKKVMISTSYENCKTLENYTQR